MPDAPTRPKLHTHGLQVRGDVVSDLVQAFQVAASAIRYVGDVATPDTSTSFLCTFFNPDPEMNDWTVDSISSITALFFPVRLGLPALALTRPSPVQLYFSLEASQQRLWNVSEASSLPLVFGDGVSREFLLRGCSTCCMISVNLTMPRL